MRRVREGAAAPVSLIPDFPGTPPRLGLLTPDDPSQPLSHYQHMTLLQMQLRCRAYKVQDNNSMKIRGLLSRNELFTTLVIRSLQT